MLSIVIVVSPERVLTLAETPEFAMRVATSNPVAYTHSSPTRHVGTSSTEAVPDDCAGGIMSSRTVVDAGGCTIGESNAERKMPSRSRQTAGRGAFMHREVRICP